MPNACWDDTQKLKVMPRCAVVLLVSGDALHFAERSKALHLERWG